MGVSSFGNLRINVYLQLPVAYRSLSRPSSAPDAKAFTLRSCSLELSFNTCRVWFCSELSEFLNFLRISLRCEKTFFRLLHFALSPLSRIFHLSVKLYSHVSMLPFLERLNNFLFCPLLFVSTQIIFFYSIVNDLPVSGLGILPYSMVGLDGLEPSTSRLSGARSSHLSYKPVHSWAL